MTGKTVKTFLKLSYKIWIFIGIIVIIVIGQFLYNPGFKGLFGDPKENSYETVTNLIDETDTSNTIKSLAKDAVANEQEHNNKINALGELFLDDLNLKDTDLINSLINKLELYKKYNNQYIENMSEQYQELGANLNDLSQYSKGERMSKQKDLIDYDNYFADKLIKRYKYLLEIQDNIIYGEDGGFYIDDDNILNKYNNIVVEENNVQNNLAIKYNDFEEYKKEYIKYISSNQ